MKRAIYRVSSTRRPIIDLMRLFLTTFVGIIIGMFLGLSYPAISLPKARHFSLSPYTFLDTLFSVKNNVRGSAPQTYIHNVSKIWVPTNPHGAERLPPGIVVSESDLYPREVQGLYREDLTIKPKYLVTFTVGAAQKDNIDSAIKKFSDNFTFMLFHYDGRGSEWDDFEWSNRAIHVSAQKQTKWWYAKRFLHPDIIASFEYIFVWDEDLGLEHFDGEEYIRLVKKHNLQISQPGLDPNSILTWQMTKRKEGSEVHKVAIEENGKCRHPHLPPCAAFVEIMATVFSRSAWRCVWYMIQNDLVHGWGLDFALRKCVQPAHEKIGVVDSQWIVHRSIPSLGNQGKPEDGKAPWEGVRARCITEWRMFHKRFLNAEIGYYASIGIRIIRPPKWESLPVNITRQSPRATSGGPSPASSKGPSSPTNSRGH